MARQLRRRARRHPLLAAAAVLGALVLAAVIVAHLAALVILAAVGGAEYALGRRNRTASARTPGRYAPAPDWHPGPAAIPAAPARPAPRDRGGELAAVTAERDQLAAEAARLRRQLADARASAELAWDAAADRPAARRAQQGDAGGQRAAVLADPRGGARPLIPS